MRKARWISFIAAFALCVTMLAGCGGKDATTKYDVKFYDGTAVLKTIQVESGQTAERWTPEKTDYDFVDWYSTPSKNHKFDFAAKITKNTDVYAGFSKYQADTRVFAICGAGTSNVLKTSEWGKVIGSRQKMAKAADKNDYTLTCDLMVNDAFQFALNSDFLSQRGFGYMTTDKDSAGNVCFAGTGTGFGDEGVKKQNIVVKKSGNYTFKLTTHPAEDVADNTTDVNPFDTISWTRNGDPNEPVESVVDYYIKGENISAWAYGSTIQTWDGAFTPSLKMTQVDNIYTLSVFLKANEQFMFQSKTDGAPSSAVIKANALTDAAKTYVDGTTGNIKAKADGTYTFTYDSKAGTLGVAFDAAKVPQAEDFYLCGPFAGSDGWNSCLFKDEYKLNLVQSTYGVYSITGVQLNVGDVLAVKSFKAGSANVGGDSWSNMVATYNSLNLFGAKTTFSAVGDNDPSIKALNAGTYTITLNSYSDALTIVEETSATEKDVYVKGAMNNFEFKDEWKMTKAADGTFEMTLTFPAATITPGTGDGEDTSNGWWIGTVTVIQDMTEGNGKWCSALGTAGDANNLFKIQSWNITYFGTTEKAIKVVFNTATNKIDFYTVA